MWSARAWRALRRRNWAERAAIVEAVLALAVARLGVRCLSFERLAPHLGRHMAETGPEAMASAQLARAIGSSVTAVAPWLPWRCLCLEQAIAAQLMLRRRGIASTLYLGVGRGEQALEAHAWLRSGELILTGATGRERYAVVASYAAP
jgi:hypothetical protein